MFYDKVCELGTTVGATAFLLGGAPAGSAQRTWQSQAPNGSVVFYVAQTKDGSKFEIGYGTLTYGAPAQLSRNLIASSSGALIAWTSADIAAGYIVFSAPLGVVMLALMMGQGFVARPAWAQQGLAWPDVSAGWNTRVIEKLFNGIADVERGRYEGVPGIYVPSPRKFWVDHGTADYAATVDDIGKVHEFDVTAADRALTLPAGAAAGHGFALFGRGYGGSSHNVVLTPAGSDAIDQGGGGATLAIPGTRPFSVEWDGAKAQWRTNIYTGPVTADAFRTSAGNVNAQTGTTYALAASDNGKTVTLSNAAAIALTVPAGLPAGFSCALIQRGAGQVTITAGGGVTLESRTGLKLVGQFSAAALLYVAANTYSVSGDLSS